MRSSIRGRFENFVAGVDLSGCSIVEHRHQQATVLRLHDELSTSIQEIMSYIEDRAGELKSASCTSTRAELLPPPFDSWRFDHLPRYQKILHDLDIFERKIRYTVAGRPLFALRALREDVFENFLDHWKAVVTRLIWLLDTRLYGKPMFLDRWRDRYAADEWHKEFPEQLQNLDTDFH